LETQLIIIEELSIIPTGDIRVVPEQFKQRTKDDKESNQQTQGQQLKAND